MIILCGSQKYEKQITALYDKLLEHNIPAIMPNFERTFRKNDSDNEKLVKQQGLLLQHFRDIKKASIVVICNFGRYCGVSTTIELTYAMSQDKFIVSLMHDEETAREIFYDIILEDVVDFEYKASDTKARETCLEEIVSRLSAVYEKIGR